MFKLYFKIIIKLEFTLELFSLMQSSVWLHRVQEPFAMPVAVMQIGFVFEMAEHCSLEVHGTQPLAEKYSS